MTSAVMLNTTPPYNKRKNAMRFMNAGTALHYEQRVISANMELSHVRNYRKNSPKLNLKGFHRYHKPSIMNCCYRENHCGGSTQ